MDKLIKKYLEGETTPEENQRVVQWVNQSVQNKNYFKSLRRLYDLTIWRKDLFIRQSRSKYYLGKVSFYASRIAVAALLVLIVLYTYKSVENKDFLFWANQEVNDMIDLDVPVGKYVQVDLSDGTKAWLNSKSVFSYPEHFKGDRREVCLSGEGYFIVAHDPEHPFIVRTDGYDIQVVGTEFNVRTLDNSGTFETSLLQGSVEIQSHFTSKRVVLEPDQRVVAENGEMRITSFDKNEFLWKDGILFIQDKTLREILPILEKYFDVRFVVEEDVDASGKKYVGKFRIDDGIEHILKIFLIQNNIVYKINLESNVITLKRK